jgi:hypothetical protein
MTQPLRRAYADPHYAIFFDTPQTVGVAAGPGTPGSLAPAAGYAVGALWIDTTNGHLYRNSGTTAVAVWTQIDAGTALGGLTATSTELNTLHGQTLTTGAGAGITGGTGTVYQNSVQLSGGIYTTRILIDLTGLASSTTDLDIIGVGTSAAHLGQITAAQNGTILGGTMTCLEVPTGGVADIDFYWATEATGKFDDGIAALTETALITSGGNWTLALTKAIADPVGIANGYLYLTGGAAGTAATYTAGKFLITLFGY